MVWILQSDYTSEHHADTEKFITSEILSAAMLRLLTPRRFGIGNSGTIFGLHMPPTGKH